MPGYVIADIEVTDPVAYKAYMEEGQRATAEHGGRFLVRGGAVEPVEGGWTPKRVVVIEFPSVAQARAWWASEAYQHARKLREGAAMWRAVLVEGAAPPSG